MPAEKKVWKTKLHCNIEMKSYNFGEKKKEIVKPTIFSTKNERNKLDAPSRQDLVRVMH